MPAIYDDQKERKSGAEYDSLGVDPPKTSTNRESEVDELKKLYDADAIKDEDRNTRTTSKRSSAGSSGALGSAASFVTNLTPKATPTQFLAKIAKSRGGVVGGIVAGIITAVSIVGIIQAPNFIINHLRETLLGNISEVQTNQSLRYRRLFMSPDGRRADKLATDLRRQGYQVEITKGKLTSITPPGQSVKISTAQEISEHLSDYMELRHPLRTSRWKTKQMNSFYEYYKISRKSVIAQVDTPIEDPDRVINKAIAGEVITDEGDVRFTPEDSDSAEGEQSDIDRSNEEYRRIVEGDGVYDDIQAKLKDGVSIEDLTDDEKRLLRLSDNIDQEVRDLAQRASSGSIGSKTLGGIKSFFNPTDFLDKICTAKFRLRAIQVAARLYRAREMAKYAAIFIKASDDTRRGNVNPTLMNSLMKRVTAVDSNGNAIGASPGFAYAVKKKFSKSTNDTFKGTYGVDGKLAGFPGEVYNGLERVPLTSESQCRVVQNVAFQVGSGAAELGVTIISGGTGRVAGEGTEQLVKRAVREAVESIISKQTAKAVAGSVAVEVSFEAAMALVQLYAEKSLSVNFTGQEKGGQLGNILVGGSGVLNKQRSLGAGMVPATTRQYAQAQRESIELKYAINKQKSWYERTLAMNNPDSLAFGVIHDLAYSPGIQQGSVPNTIGNIGSSLASGLQNISSIFGRGLLTSVSPRAAAQVADEVETETITVKGNELVTDPAGNFLPVLTPEIQNIDPVKNKDALISSGDIDPTSEQPMSDSFKKHKENCIDNIDTLGIIESKDQSKPEYDCLATQPKTRQFKAHLAYLDMKDSIDAALFPDEIAGASGASNQSPAGPAGAVDGAKGQDTSNQQCQVGTDAGIGDSPQPGIRIRLCRVNSTIVNVAIERNVKAIFDGAASAGINLGGSGFRSNQDQIRVRRNNCGSSQYDIYEKPSGQCSPPTARPGNSMHEWGLAVDFTQNGRILSRSSSGFTWIQNNQAVHNLKNLPSEAWHWSSNGN